MLGVCELTHAPIVYTGTRHGEALNYITLPGQMLGKSFTLMPVMVWGLAVHGMDLDLSMGVGDWMWNGEGAVWSNGVVYIYRCVLLRVVVSSSRCQFTPLSLHSPDPHAFI